MNEICAKVYYEKSTGKIIVITSEMITSLERTTKEQDIQMYEQLKNKTVDEVAFIELEYGTLASTFNNLKSYYVNLESKTLECIYYTQEELDAQSEAIENAQDITNRIQIISDYASLDNNAITTLENAILEYEMNLIMGGM